MLARLARDRGGQASVEAALLVPVTLVLVALLAQPACVLYTRSVMAATAADGTSKRDAMILAHGSAEPGHAAMTRLLGKQPLLDLELRLGEGTGAALAMPLLDAAAAVLTRMTTFEEAAVTTEGLK